MTGGCFVQAARQVELPNTIQEKALLRQEMGTGRQSVTLDDAFILVISVHANGGLALGVVVAGRGIQPLLWLH